MPRALQNLLGVGRATTVDDTGELQTMQVTEGAAGTGFAARVIDKVRRITEFGFTSVPPIDAEVVMFRRGGDRSCSIVVGTSHRPSRPRDLMPGDTAVYDVRGAILKFTDSGPILDCAGLELIIRNASKITLDCPDVEMTGNLLVTGTITGLNGAAPVEIGALRDAYNAHHHTGVQTGTGTSDGTDQPV